MFGPLAVLLGLQNASAQTVTVTIDPEIAAAAGVDPAQIEAQIRDATDGELKLDRQRPFLNSMANANAMATRGMGVDYASNPQRFWMGFGVGTAVSGIPPSFVKGGKELPKGGFSAQVAVAAGINLGFGAGDDSVLRRFVLSVDGFQMNAATGPFSARFGHIGAHVQIKLVRPPHKGIVEWGGLDLTTGFEHSSYVLDLQKTFPIDQGQLHWKAGGQFTVDANATTIPIELSTNVRLVVLGLYAGGAADLRPSVVANTELRLDGDLTYNKDGTRYTLGTVEARARIPGSADLFSPRIFVGTQINVTLAKIYGQINYGPADESFGGHIGFRVAM